MSSSKHIVILPLNAQGHLIPTVALAKQIVAQRSDCTITITTTPLNIQYIRSTILTTDSSKTLLPLSTSSLSQSNIRLVELPFNSSDHGLPPNIENTDALPVPQVVLLVQALIQTLRAPFHSLISSMITDQGSHTPLCIISDACFGWAVEVAKIFSISSITFSPAGAFGTAAFLSFWLNLPHRASDEYTLPGFPENYQFKSSHLLPFIRGADGTDDWSKFFQVQFSLSLGSAGWLCNTVEEIEGIGMEILRKYTKLPIWAIGPLLPSTMLRRHKPSSTSTSKIYVQHGVKEYGASPSKCIEWLDLHAQRSVIYISFGSQLTITSSQMMELAKGLEESGHPIIWVIKPPFGFNVKDEFKAEWLPERFEQKMAQTGRGLVIHGWAPQLEILSHPSTGAFLSHCGWNSVLESLSQGVPIIGWPMAVEQGCNMTLMEELGVCVELARGLESVIVGKEVKRIIDLVMDKNNGKREELEKNLVKVVEKMRAAVREESGDVHVKGSSLEAMDDFITTLQENMYR